MKMNGVGRASKIVLVLVMVFALFGGSSVFAEMGFEKGTSWVVDFDKNPLTDEIDLLIFTVDVDTLDGGSSFDAKLLGIRYSGEVLELVLSWSEYLADNDKVSLRFDGGEVIDMKWSLAENKRGLFFPRRTRDIEEFIEKILHAEKLVVGVTPWQKRQQIAQFEIAGLAKVIDPYLEDMGLEELRPVVDEILADSD